MDAAVAAVAVKLPEFWKGTPTAWFHTVEAQFAVRNITADDTKYHYVVASLGSEPATALTNFLANPPANDKYNTLKAELLKVYEPSAKQKKEALLSLSGLGDRKPSELLRHMQTLHQADKDDILFMSLFLQQLPQPVRAILAARDFDDVAKLAEAADDVLRQQDSLVTNAVHSSCRQSSSSAAPPSAPGLCYYHRRFGDRAKNCRPGCPKQGNAEASH